MHDNYNHHYNFDYGYNQGHDRDLGRYPRSENYFNSGFQKFSGYSHDSSNFSWNPQERSRLPYKPNHFQGNNNYNRNRQWSRGFRRSLSAPRSWPEEENGSRYSGSRPNTTNYPTRKTSVSYEAKNEENSRVQLKPNRKSPPLTQLKKFKSIFAPTTSLANAELKPSAIVTAEEALTKKCNTNKIQQSEVNEDEKPLLKNEDSNPISSGPKLKTEDKNNIPLARAEELAISKFYGDSLTELQYSELKLLHFNLPVVDWLKEPNTIFTLPEYNPNKVVGGDGISLELFYLCKFCKMFTGGRQIEAHLKSKYHYDHYKEFLTTGIIPSDSSSSSSGTSSETESKQSGSPQKKENIIMKNAMEIDDPSEIVYKCHEELDFD